MVNRLLLLSAYRHLRRHPWQTWLSIVGIALGVTVIVAVDLANQSARQGFLLSAESLTGKATHQLVGGSGGIPERFYRELRIDRGLHHASPLVQGLVKLGPERLRLIGVDPMADTGFRRFVPELGSNAARRLLTDYATVLLSSITAQRLGLQAGDRMQVSIAGRPATLHVVGLLQGENPAVLEGLLLADISTAQELLGRAGRLDRIDLILSPQQAEALGEGLPPDLVLEVPESRTRVMMEMIEAFQTNLGAMSLLALLVGAFLIYNTMTFSVLRRRHTLATLRILGVTRQTLFRLLLLEAALLGMIGTLLGLGLGITIAHYLIGLVTRTINDLYFVLTVKQLFVGPLLLLKGGLIGIGVTLLAALAPAVEAAATVPVSALRRSQLEQRVHHGLPWVALLGGLTLLFGLLLVRQEDNGLTGGFVGLFLIIAGYSLMMPLVVTLLGRLSNRLAHGDLLTRFALRGIGANLSRTGLSIAALSVAVAATLGVSIMITSFRSTVADWLGYTLRSDIYVSALSSRANGSDGALLPDTRKLIASVPGVAETSGGRRTTVKTAFGSTDLLAIDVASASHKGFRFAAPPLPDVWPRYRRGELILVSEPFAYKHHLRSGDKLVLHTPEGTVSLPIGGVFYDYGSDQGLISLAQAAYARLWDDPALSTIGVFLHPGADGERVAQRIREVLEPLDQDLGIRSNREIREFSMGVFDRTFAITQVLRLLVIGVAFVGVLSALMALQLERTREQAVLRATGVTPAQISRLTLLQTGIMGLYAGVLSLPLGWLMSEVLIEVINRRSFGWSIMTRLPPQALVEAVFLALFAALLAGLYPAWRMGKVQPARALREE